MLKKIKNKIYKFLLWTEKWTKTDMVYLAKGGSWMFSGNIIGSVGSFILALAYANLLPKETYASYKYILSFAGIIAIPSLTGLGGALTKAIAQGYEGSFMEIFKVKLKWGILSFFTGLTISVYYFLQNNLTLGVSFLFIAIFIPLIGSFSIYSSYLQGSKQFKKSSIYNNLKNITLTTAILLAVYFSKSITIILFTSYSLTLFISAFIFYYILKHNKLNNKKDPTTISYGKHLSLMNILATFAEQFDKILTWHFLGPINLAIYSFAIIPITQMQSFFKLIPILAFPKIANQDNEVIKKTLPGKILKFSSIILIIIILYIITAPFLYKLFFPEYIKATKYSQLFSLTMLFFPARMINHTLIAKAQKKSLYIIQIINPVTKILLYLFLLPTYGLYGLIYAFILTSMLSTIYQLYFLRKI